MKLERNTELEDSILSASFYSDSALYEIISRCTPNDFTGSRIEIFKVLKDAFDKYKAVDLPIFLSLDKDLRELGIDLFTKMVSDDMLSEHIIALKNDSKKRELQVAHAKKDFTKMRELLNVPDEQVDFVFSEDELKKEIYEYKEKGNGSGETTGWAELDKFYNVSKGQLTVVTGIPGSGKSNFIDAMMVQMAGKNDWNFVIFSPENQPVSRHLRSLIEKYSQLPMFKGIHQSISDTEFDLSIKWVNRHFILMNPNKMPRRVDIILNEISKQIEDKKIDGCVIDPWNELEHTRPFGMNESEYTAQVLMQFKQFAGRHNIHLWIIAHPTKLRKIEKGENEGKYPIPTLYDISGSANWRNKADCGLVLYRDFETNEVTLYIQKIRFKDNGELGNLKLYYEKDTGRYSI